MLPRSRRSVESGDEALVVALVEADGWFVKYVENAAQAGTDLCGETNALAFAAGECRGAERESDR